MTAGGVNSAGAPPEDDVRGRVVIDGEWQWIGTDAPAVDERPVIEDVDVVSAETARAPTLGELLRAERERQGMGLDQIEAATRIRVAQLRAIEEDRLDALPAEAYARGFVRAYADQLAIDGDATVRLFNEQWGRQSATDPEPVPPILPPLAASVTRPLGVASVVLALALLVVSATVFLMREGDRSSPAAQISSTSHAPSSTVTNTPPRTPPPPPPPVPALMRLTVTATTGACWLEARRGSATGRLLVEQTLAQGDAVRLHGKRVWLRLGDPARVRLRLNGRPLRLAAAADPINLLVSRRGARAA
jgi:cytoskeleton protein RodZ